jgi:hypothetical protein
MTLGSTQLLTEMRTRNLPGVKERPARKADLITICEPIAWNMWKSQWLTMVWASMTCYSNSFTFFYMQSHEIENHVHNLYRRSLGSCDLKHSWSWIASSNSARNMDFALRAFILLFFVSKLCDAPMHRTRISTKCRNVSLFQKWIPN